MKSNEETRQAERERSRSPTGCSSHGFAVGLAGSVSPGGVVRKVCFAWAVDGIVGMSCVFLWVFPSHNTRPWFYLDSTTLQSMCGSLLCLERAEPQPSAANGTAWRRRQCYEYVLHWVNISQALCVGSSCPAWVTADSRTTSRPAKAACFPACDSQPMSH